jgi:anthranilate/para-aminobenzoate synthase component II
MIGVCRGAQMMCAFAGGYLIQHVRGHQTDHFITTSEGDTFRTTSCHHQMMYPYNIPHEMLAWSTENRSTIYEGEIGEDLSDRMASRKEPEVVYYPTIRGLAIQGHPEWALGSEFADYCNEKIQEKLFNMVLEK